MISKADFFFEQLNVTVTCDVAILFLGSCCRLSSTCAMGNTLLIIETQLDKSKMFMIRIKGE